MTASDPAPQSLVKSLLLRAAWSALLTFVAAAALYASDPLLAVLAVAATAVLITFFTSLHSTEDRSALDALGPASALSTTTVGRAPWAELLPTVAAQVVGAVAAGFAAGALGGRWGEPLPFDARDLVAAGVGAAVVGLVTAWTTSAVDGGGHDALVVLPFAIGAGVLPLGLAAAASPAVVLGLATADLVPWTAALVAAAAAAVAAVLGGWFIGALLPSDHE